MGIDYDVYSVKDKRALELRRRNMAVISRAQIGSEAVTDNFGFTELVPKITKEALCREIELWENPYPDEPMDTDLGNAKALLAWMEEELTQDFVLLQESCNELIGPWRSPHPDGRRIEPTPGWKMYTTYGVELPGYKEEWSC